MHYCFPFLCCVNQLNVWALQFINHNTCNWVMANYKLYYFLNKGRAEAIRLLFAYKDIQYEDVRIPKDKWPEYQTDMPFGVMPVLEEDGKKLGGSVIILRYLAEKPEFNVAGSNAWENAWLANIGDFIEDFNAELLKVHLESDENKKKEYHDKLVAESIPKYLGKMNEMSKDTGYLCCGKLTWPDLLLFSTLSIMVEHKAEFLDNFHGLAKLLHNIESDPNIAKWIAKRPKTAF